MRARGSDRLRRPANVRKDARRGLSPSVLLRLALGLALALWVIIPTGVLMGAFASADTTTGASTTGTASTVSPSTIAVGGSLAYTLSGFPPSSTVEVLVDDGGLVQPAASDAGVVARISVSKDGRGRRRAARLRHGGDALAAVPSRGRRGRAHLADPHARLHQ